MNVGERVLLTAAAAASVAEEVELESTGKPGGTLLGRAGSVAAVDGIVELEMFTGSFSIVFTGGLIDVEVFSGGS